MRALPVRPEPLWRTDFRQRIAVSLWFLPAVFAAAAIAAANRTIWLDSRVDAPIGVRPDLVSDPGTAATFAAPGTCWPVSERPCPPWSRPITAWPAPISTQHRDPVTGRRHPGGRPPDG
jgi:hypothetical protein